MNNDKNKSNSAKLAELDLELKKAKEKIKRIREKRNAIAKRIELEKRETETAKALLFYKKFAKHEEKLNTLHEREGAQ